MFESRLGARKAPLDPLLRGGCDERPAGKGSSACGAELAVEFLSRPERLPTASCADDLAAPTLEAAFRHLGLPSPRPLFRVDTVWDANTRAMFARDVSLSAAGGLAVDLAGALRAESDSVWP